MSTPPVPSPNIVITDCDHADIEPESRVFAEAGFDVKLAECETSDDVVEQARDADGIINQYAPIDESVLAALERCKVVVRYGVGVDTVDVDAASRQGVWVVNVPDYGVEEVSDHALAMMMNLFRGVGQFDRAVRAGTWDVNMIHQLYRVSNLTVGVLGCGRIGAAFARKARCLGMSVLGYDVSGVPEELVRAGVEQADFNELLTSSDAISLHLPLTEKTHHLIGAEQFRQMKPRTYLINTARGGLVDSAALLEALNEGAIAGAALDVLETEPPEKGDALVSHERVVNTPHAAWYSEESYEALKAGAAREVVRVLTGEPPYSPVNEPTERRSDG